MESFQIPETDKSLWLLSIPSAMVELAALLDCALPIRSIRRGWPSGYQHTSLPLQKKHLTIIELGQSFPVP
ncbi:hypothetical protein HJFPF1_06864 [Paramyrothecium foliicola]|nr:hypothetical protein HJFPF1_06864 [Paramyrothecium foliicola]